DRVERLGVPQGRVARLVDEVELDLDADVGVGHREVLLAQHRRKDIEVPTDLGAVASPILTGELAGFDVLSHGAQTRPRSGPCAARAGRIRTLHAVSGGACHRSGCTPACTTSVNNRAIEYSGSCRSASSSATIARAPSPACH